MKSRHIIKTDASAAKDLRNAAAGHGKRQPLWLPVTHFVRMHRTAIGAKRYVPDLVPSAMQAYNVYEHRVAISAKAVCAT